MKVVKVMNYLARIVSGDERPLVAAKTDKDMLSLPGSSLKFSVRR